MNLLTKEELNSNKKQIIKQIKSGEVFISPTDTIYGLSCDATNKKAVNEIRSIKNRSDSPLSIIAPSINWIKENCFIDEKVKKWLNKLPGPYTLILKLKNKTCIAKNVSKKTNSIGIRFPDHWFTEFVEELNIPLITTSANKTGENFMTSLDNLEEEIKNKIKFIIYEGEKKSKPSRIVNIEKEKIKER
jgi:L-threonylcarbamoyladenylate synthase